MRADGRCVARAFDAVVAEHSTECVGCGHGPASDLDPLEPLLPIPSASMITEIHSAMDYIVSLAPNTW